MGKNRVNMLQGPLLPNIITFVIPVILSSVLQLMFNAADLMVVGQFRGSDALAAVGATGILTSLLLSLSSGLNIGVDVTCANRRGARDQEALERCMYSSLVLGALIGMRLFRHKTKHWYFWVVNLLGLAWQAAVAGYWLTR